MTKTKEALAQEAAQRSVRRKARANACMELMKYVHELIEPIEKLHGVCDVVAEQHGTPKDDLWKWAVKQLTE
jgi:hypothetical protein